MFAAASSVSDISILLLTSLDANEFRHETSGTTTKPLEHCSDSRKFAA